MLKPTDERYDSMPDEELLRLVREHFKGERSPGIGLLNRHFPVGYARAARLVAMLNADASGAPMEASDREKAKLIRRLSP